METSEAIRPEHFQLQPSQSPQWTTGPLLNHEVHGHQVLLRFTHVSLGIQFLHGGILRITTLGENETFPRPTLAVHLLKPLVSPLRIEKVADSLRVCGDFTCLEVDNEGGNWRVMGIHATDRSRLPLVEFHQVSLIRDETTGAWQGFFNKQAEDHFYGLGEKTGFLDKQNERYEMWNSDVYAPHVPEIEALYQSIPFLLHMRRGSAYGFFLDNPGKTIFDMRSSADTYLISVATGELDGYYIPGPSLKDVLQGYTQLTGRPFLPPKWALGYHQSRYSYMSQSEVLEVAQTFRDKQIPCDALYLDIHYMRGYRVFTFDPVRFPDPAQMTRALTEMGFHTVTIVDPGVKRDPQFQPYLEGLMGGLFCAYAEGDLFRGEVWPGESVFPDFANPQSARWWGDLHRFYVDRGVTGIWNDMNEPAVFNETKTMDMDVLHHFPDFHQTHGEVHNLYGLWMTQATYEGMRRHLQGERPFVLTRAGFAGIQRYAAVWTGDNRSFWEHMAMAIPMVLNLGLSGVAMAGPDIGGFAHHTSAELLARWTQMGVFFPFARNHSAMNTLRQEPWSFGPEVEDINRRYIGLRYQLLPHLYSLFYEATQSGLPVMRPLVMEYPDDVHVTNLCDEFLVGSEMLVAPVLRPGDKERLVYLPHGTWYDYWSGERFVGGRSVVVPAPLDTLPLFVRAGAIVPQSAVTQHTSEVPEELTYQIHLGGPGTTGEYRYYEDDGHSLAHEQGVYNEVELSFHEHPKGVVFHWNYRYRGMETLYSSWNFSFRQVPSGAVALVQGDWSSTWTHDLRGPYLSVRVNPRQDRGEIVIHYSHD